MLHLSKPSPILRADVPLDGSKSISNRALLLLALAGANPDEWLTHCSSSTDTLTLRRHLFQPDGDTYDAGDAGTTFRFLTAYLALLPGTQVLTGSPRMRERPVGPLVEALRTLGADIQCLEQEGFPPLRIGEWREPGKAGALVRVAADVSSQFLSALAMIGPCLPEGLRLVPEGRLVSKPYLDLTVKMMRYFGAGVEWEDETLVIAPGMYRAQPLTVEADWSAAAFWYAMVALSEDGLVRLKGLQRDSWQGDAAVAEMMAKLGVGTAFETDESGATTVQLSKKGGARRMFEQDFLDTPDLAQPLAVACAGLGVQGLFSGLETLSIKETDRIAALKNELKKIGVAFHRLPARFSKKQPERQFYALEGRADWPPEHPPRFATYGDHRMALSLASLAMLGPVEIEHPELVSKSYPQFWAHLEGAGFIPSLRAF